MPEETVAQPPQATAPVVVVEPVAAPAATEISAAPLADAKTLREAAIAEATAIMDKHNAPPPSPEPPPVVVPPVVPSVAVSPDAALVERAKQAGMTREVFLASMQRGTLAQDVALLEQFPVAQAQPAAKGATPAPPNEESPEFKALVAAKTQEWLEDGVDDSIAAKRAVREARREWAEQAQRAEVQQTLQQQESARFTAAVDAAFDTLEAELPGAFGKGALKDLPPAQQQARKDAVQRFLMPVLNANPGMALQEAVGAAAYAAQRGRVKTQVQSQVRESVSSALGAVSTLARPSGAARPTAPADPRAASVEAVKQIYDKHKIRPY